MATQNQPLTLEQQQFAEDHHDLIYGFLRLKRLSQDYYDILVFGYLRAVRKYLERPELRRYRFSTIAYAAMNTDLINHYRKQTRLKRKAYIVSLDTPVYCDCENLTLIDMIPTDGTAANNMAYAQLLHEISAILPSEQYDMIQMKSGYSDREIAKHHDVPVRSVQEILSAVREILAPRFI